MQRDKISGKVIVHEINLSLRSVELITWEGNS